MSPRPRRVVLITVEPGDHDAVLAPLPPDHAARSGAGSGHAPTTTDRIVRLHPLKKAEDQLAALGTDVAGLVVVAEYTTHLVDAVLALCSVAQQRGIPVLLVRRGLDELADLWPRVPVNAVVDLGRYDDCPVIHLLAHAVLLDHASSLPLTADAFAAVEVLYGDRRRVAFARSLAEHFCGQRVFGLAPPHVRERDLPVLRFHARSEPQWASGVYYVDYRDFGSDPRRYEDDVVPADDLEQQAAAIAALHVAHGSWPATRAAVEACGNGVVEEACELLFLLAQKLREPSADTWTGLCALADNDPACRWPEWQARPPGHDHSGVRFTAESRAAFWAAVDDETDGDIAAAPAPAPMPLVADDA